MLRRHASGDPDAFGILFTRHRERLWAVAVRTLSDAEEAADALQDAMISAFRQADGFRGDSAVTTWLHRIVVNACLDRLRRKAARPTASGLDEDALEALAARPDPFDSVTDSDTAMDVAAALRLLPPDQRAALVLVDMMGYPVADAAETLGTSVGTVKSRCARGRARLLPHLAHLRAAAARDGSGGTAGSTPGVPAAASEAPGAMPSSVPPATTGQPGGNRSAPGRVSPAQGGGDPQP